MMRIGCMFLLCMMPLAAQARDVAGEAKYLRERGARHSEQARFAKHAEWDLLVSEMRPEQRVEFLRLPLAQKKTVIAQRVQARQTRAAAEFIDSLDEAQRARSIFSSAGARTLQDAGRALQARVLAAVVHGTVAREDGVLFRSGAQEELRRMTQAERVHLVHVLERTLFSSNSAHSGGPLPLPSALMKRLPAEAEEALQRMNPHEQEQFLKRRHPGIA
ncbi:MAG: hypothetical protein EXS14_09480 [Planctomycetes bacterium]|nr:hypothetical protein [Planctomycetota bacterium]